MRRRLHIASGQTLIEMLIAFFVISIGLYTAVTLVFSNLNLVERDTDAVIAVNLAREGIELAKQVRDSNWMAGNPFDAGLHSGTSYTATPIWEATLLAPSTGPTFSFAATDFTDPHAQVVTTASGLMANAASEATITGTATLFKRLLTLHPICSDYSVLNNGTDCGSLPKIGVRVESHVQWSRKGAQDLTLYEDLYDWR
jgi:type II secretory pathway pseudopilin PulG